MKIPKAIREMQDRALPIAKYLINRIELLYILTILYPLSIISDVGGPIITQRSQEIIIPILILMVVGLLSVYVFRRVQSKKTAIFLLLLFHLLIAFSFLQVLGFRDIDNHFWNTERVEEKGMVQYFTGYLKEVDESDFFHPAFIQKRNSPLWALMLYALQAPFGVSLRNAVVLTALVYTLTMLPLYRLARNTYNREVAILALILFNFLAGPLFYSHTAFTDYAQPLFFMVSLMFISQHKRTESRCRLILSAIFVSLAALIKFTILPLLAFYIIYLFLNRKSLRGFTINSGIFVTTILLICALLYMAGYSIVDNFSMANRLEMGFVKDYPYFLQPVYTRILTTLVSFISWMGLPFMLLLGLDLTEKTAADKLNIYEKSTVVAALPFLSSFGGVSFVIGRGGIFFMVMLLPILADRINRFEKKYKILGMTLVLQVLLIYAFYIRGMFF